VVQFFVTFLDSAFVGEIAEHTFEIGAQRILQSKCAGDFASADFAGLIAYEGEEIGL
jgi:hypothetical protein